MKDKCTENFKCKAVGTSVSVLSRFQNADFLLCYLKILFNLLVFQLRSDCFKMKTMVIDETLDQNGQHLSICVHFVLILIGSCHTENIAQPAAYHCLLYSLLDYREQEQKAVFQSPGLVKQIRKNFMIWNLIFVSCCFYCLLFYVRGCLHEKTRTGASFIPT